MGTEAEIGVTQPHGRFVDSHVWPWALEEAKNRFFYRAYRGRVALPMP